MSVALLPGEKDVGSVFGDKRPHAGLLAGNFESV